MGSQVPQRQRNNYEEDGNVEGEDDEEIEGEGEEEEEEEKEEDQVDNRYDAGKQRRQQFRDDEYAVQKPPTPKQMQQLTMQKSMEGTMKGTS